MTFDDLDDVLDEDGKYDEEEQSNESYEDLDDVLDEDGNPVGPDTAETDDEPEPLTKSKGNGDYMDSGSIDDSEIANHGVDHGYSRDWSDQDNDADDDGTVNDDSIRNSVELEQSDGGYPDPSSIDEMDGITSGGVSSGYGEEWDNDDETIEQSSGGLSCDVSKSDQEEELVTGAGSSGYEYVD